MTVIPNNKKLGASIASLAALAVTGCAGTEAIAAGAMGDAFAAAAGIPQMEAFLPYETQVPPTEPLAIDGDYKISTLGKTIRIDRGRAYAIDPWTHALTLKIRPNMVVQKDIRKTGPNTYTGEDLPLLGTATMTALPDGRISVSVASIPKYDYVLIPVGGPQTPSPEPAPIEEPDTPESDTGDCETLGIDPNTDEVVCLD
ncbi:MAG: hypothetical protein AAGF33_07820 [Pseudomonadota bacterium]